MVWPRVGGLPERMGPSAFFLLAIDFVQRGVGGLGWNEQSSDTECKI